MDDITYANKIMNSLLMEAELKDSFAELSEGVIIRLTTTKGVEELFEVAESLAGRIKMVSKKSKMIYTFTKDAINNGVMTIYHYKKDKPNFEGTKVTFELKSMVIGKEGGDFTEIDIVDEEAHERVGEINSQLKSATKGDILYISTEEKNSKGDIVNTILLKVVESEKEMLTCVLEGIESENDDGETNSYVMDKLVKIFKMHNIYIRSNNLVKIVNGSLTLTLLVGKKSFDIQNIIYIETHPNEDSNIDVEDARELAKQEFLNKHGNSPEFKQALAKTPTFWDTFMGATPKGRKEIEKIVNRSVTDNSYLTKGNTISFKLLSNTIFIDRNFKLTQNKKIYAGTMEKNNVLKLGTRRRGHFELQIIKEVSPSIYNVKIRFCNKDLNCESQGEGTIKVIRNG
jgi:hypothetical protein|tara:strand:- start:1684 stop:2883 length:1200 start_codon:yes stop_codon:yes gene_type:complete